MPRPRCGPGPAVLPPALPEPGPDEAHHPGTGRVWGLTLITASDEILLLRLLLRPNPVLDTASRKYELQPDGARHPGSALGRACRTPSASRRTSRWLAAAGPGTGWHVHSIGCFTGRGGGYSIVVLTMDNSVHGLRSRHHRGHRQGHQPGPEPGATGRVPSSVISPSQQTADESDPLGSMTGIATAVTLSVQLITLRNRGDGCRMPRVLVVDDEPDQRFLLRRLFTRAGYEVTKAQNGSVALAAVRESPPDLLVTDMMMPVMGARTHPARTGQPAIAHIPVLAVSGILSLRVPPMRSYRSRTTCMWSWRQRKVAGRRTWLTMKRWLPGFRD